MINTIEDEMILVQCEEKKRSDSNTLHEKFKAFHEKCQEDQAYCVGRVEGPKETKSASPVQVDLNEAAWIRFNRLNPTLEVYRWEERVPL